MQPKDTKHRDSKAHPHPTFTATLLTTARRANDLSAHQCGHRLPLQRRGRPPHGGAPFPAQSAAAAGAPDRLDTLRSSSAHSSGEGRYDHMCRTGGQQRPPNRTQMLEAPTRVTLPALHGMAARVTDAASDLADVGGKGVACTSLTDQRATS